MNNRLPSPQRGRGAGGEGITTLSQHAAVFRYLACFFGISSGIDRACTAPSLLTSLPLSGARGTEMFNLAFAVRRPAPTLQGISHLLKPRVLLQHDECLVFELHLQFRPRRQRHAAAK